MISRGLSFVAVLAMALLFSQSLTAQAPTTLRPGLKQLKDPLVEGILSRLKNLEKPRDAVDILKEALRDKSLSSNQRSRLEKELAVWHDRNEKDLVRVGASWITKEEKESKQKEADLLIEKAFLLIDTKDFRSAKEALEKASKVDEAGLRADFLLGLLNTPIVANSPETAEKHFRKVLTRAPNHLPTLNNLALCCIRQKEYAQAFEFWRRIAEIAPNTPELSHNVGRLLDETSDGRMTLGASDKKRFQDLYLDIAIAENAANRYVSGGWRYMHLTLPKAEAERTPVKDTNSMSLTSTGTGFAIAPGLVLTNRHVVDDAHSVKIEYESPTGRQQLEAKVRKIFDKHDLALVECPKLTAPAVKISTEPQRRGTEVMILGYPETGLLGKTLKATRGSITALPSDEYGGMLLFDAAANHGNSGGPISDQQGNVIAVLTVGFKLQGQITGGVTLANALPFIQENCPEYAPKSADSKLEWPDVDAAVAKSTVMVAVYQQLVKLGPTQTAKSSGSYIEDNACSVCSGVGRVRCPGKGCSRGQVSVQETVQAGTNSISGQAVFKTITKKQACPVCGGDGQVDCRGCY